MALIKMQYFSKCLGMCMSIEVILPESNQGIGVDAVGDNNLSDLPVLYLLHGYSDDQSTWSRRTSLERYASDKQIAIVMPTTHVGFYTNQKFGPFKYFDYVAKELPKICQTYFPISAKREKNFVGGLSMGGYGALKIGLTLHESFSHIIAFSPACKRLDWFPKEAMEYKNICELEQNKHLFSTDEYMKTMNFFVNFGSIEQYDNSDEDNLFKIVENLVEQKVELPKILMSCGKDDQLVGPATEEFAKHLTNLNVEHIYEVHEGSHEWEYWDTHIQTALKWLPIK